MNRQYDLFRRGGPARIYGHRGARGVLPENSLPAFDYLVDIGIDAVEIDVQLSVDQVPILLHDPQIPEAYARTGQGEWLDAPGPKIIDLTAGDLGAYTIGRQKPDHPYSQLFPGQQAVERAKIPTLERFCRWALAHPEMLLNLEVKSYADRGDLSAPPELLAQQVLALVMRHDLAGRSLLSSFDWRVLFAAQQQNPGLRTGFLTCSERADMVMPANIFDGSPWMGKTHLADYGGSLPRLISENGGALWCPYFLDLAHGDVAAAHEAGLAVNVWTVNDAEDILAMDDMGVDGIITDYPGKARSLLAGRIAAKKA